MKWITYILLIVISALAFIPCSDGVECIDDMEQSSHDHSDHEDHCTPFCSCACCGSIATVPTSTYPLTGVSDLGSLYQIRYNQIYSFDYLNAVWHPPTYS